MTSGLNTQKRVVLGKIGKVHGIKGWLRINSFASPPDNILEYPELSISIGGSTKSLRVADSKKQNSNLLVHFEGVDDPEQARELTGTELWVEATRLPELSEGNYYWHELQGMLVVNQEGQLLGQVKNLMETGANDVLVVAPTSESIDRRERLIPYLRDKVVLEVDIDHNRIQVDWDASYLD